MAHVAGELAAEGNRLLELAVLLLELTALRVDALQEGLQLLVGVVVQRTGEVELAQGPRDQHREPVGNQQRHQEDDHEGGGELPTQPPEKRRQRGARLGQTNDDAVAHQGRRVEGVAAHGLAAAHDRHLAGLLGGRDLLALRVVVHRGGVCVVVEDHGAVCRDERAARLDKGELCEARRHGVLTALVFDELCIARGLCEQDLLGIPLVHAEAQGCCGDGCSDSHSEREEEEHPEDAPCEGLSARAAGHSSPYDAGLMR